MRSRICRQRSKPAIRSRKLARGFGFILPNDGGKDVFVHVTALRRAGIDDLQPGQNVRMEVALARRGREASSIQLIG